MTEFEQMRIKSTVWYVWVWTEEKKIYNPICLSLNRVEESLQSDMIEFVKKRKNEDIKDKEYRHTHLNYVYLKKINNIQLLPLNSPTPSLSPLPCPFSPPSQMVYKGHIRPVRRYIETQKFLFFLKELFLFSKGLVPQRDRSSVGVKYRATAETRPGNIVRLILLRDSIHQINRKDLLIETCVSEKNGTVFSEDGDLGR